MLGAVATLSVLRLCLLTRGLHRALLRLPLLALWSGNSPQEEAEAIIRLVIFVCSFPQGSLCFVAICPCLETVVYSVIFWYFCVILLHFSILSFLRVVGVSSRRVNPVSVISSWPGAEYILRET